MIKTKGICLIPSELDRLAEATDAMAKAHGLHFKAMIVVVVTAEGTELAVAGCDCLLCIGRAVQALAKVAAGHIVAPN